MEYVTTDSNIEIFNDEISESLYLDRYDLKKSSCFREIEENLKNGVTSFEVEDDLSGQDAESINQCIAEVYNNCIIRSARDLRIKMKIDVSDEDIDVVARLYDAADHAEDPSYETKIVIENEFWTLEELRRWVAQDLENEDEIELEYEEALDQFIETRDAELDDYTVSFYIEELS